MKITTYAKKVRAKRFAQWYRRSHILVCVSPKDKSAASRRFQVQGGAQRFHAQRNALFRGELLAPSHGH
jgi:hypothetical protein